MSATETEEQQAPAWWSEIKLCHILADDGLHPLCGHEPEPQSIHYGSTDTAICSGCGRPNCPRCVQLDALEDALG